MSRVIIWGAGELGGRVVSKACSAGHTVHAYTATNKRHHTLRELGAVVQSGDPTEWQADDTLLLCIAGTQSLRDAIERVRHRPPPRRVVLTSSTGYYNGLGGDIDATTSHGPTERAQTIAACEGAFREWAGDAAIIIRLGGLYRQGRGPLNALKMRGHVPYGAANTTLALIHYDDAASAVWTALNHPNPQPAYLAASDPCPLRQEFYLAACVVLDIALPNFGPPSSNAPARYDVSALRKDLLPEPAHPKWQAALVP